MGRRIAAIVLPHLLCELATPSKEKTSKRPFGVILSSKKQEESPPGNLNLDAVDEYAQQAGLRSGLSIAEAQAFLADLELRTVSHQQVQQALNSIADTALAFSPTVGLSPPDTVHLDLTGAAHLHDGELCLIRELRERIAQLGHFSRIAIAAGPRVAEILARHARQPLHRTEPGQEPLDLQPLPVSALPISNDTACWLARVGVLTIQDLLRLPRNQVSPRLGQQAPDVLLLAAGHDSAPLHLYHPPPTLFEEASWDEPVDRLSALVFVLNRLCSRLATRLQGRGQALRAMSLTLQQDKAIARLQGCEETTTTILQLPVAMNRAEDLLRTIRTRLETLSLQTPCVGIRLQATQIVKAPCVQLDLSRDITVSKDALPSLLAELVAEIGPQRVGTLCLLDSHRPETRSLFLPTSCTPPANTRSPDPSLYATVTRLLPTPLLLNNLSPGSLLLLDHRIVPLEIQRVHFDTRLHDVHWWTLEPASRDYFRIWLSGGATGGAAWVYRDRVTANTWLHGWFD